MKTGNLSQRRQLPIVRNPKDAHGACPRVQAVEEFAIGSDRDVKVRTASREIGENRAT